MNKSDSRIVCAPARCAVDQANSGGFQGFQRLFDILDFHCDVVNAFTALRHKFRYRRFGSGWFQQLDSAVTDLQHCDANTLLVDLIVSADAQPDRSLVNLQSFTERLHRDADMIDLHLNLKLRIISSTSE